MVILIVELKTTSMKFLLQSKHLIKKNGWKNYIRKGQIIGEEFKTLAKQRFFAIFAKGIKLAL